MRRTFRKHYALGIAALALGLISAPASAHCDFVTGGGFIITTASGTHVAAMANFGVHGGCKKHGPDAPFWGHVNYIDHFYSPHGHFRSLTITDYRGAGASPGDEKDPKRTGTRTICGTGTTNHPSHADVYFRVEVTDNGEGANGTGDIFKIVLKDVGETTPFYSTFGDGDVGGTLKGGNIQLHKPNPSTKDFATGVCNV